MAAGCTEGRPDINDSNRWNQPSAAFSLKIAAWVTRVSQRCFYVPGLHLEGPFINKEKKGAHQEELIVGLENGMADLQRVYGSLDNVAIVTIAPELPGALDVIRQLTELGITASLGKLLAVNILNVWQWLLKHNMLIRGLPWPASPVYPACGP